MRIIFKAAPRLAFLPHPPAPDELVLQIDPNPGACLVIQAKQPSVNDTRTVDLSLVFSGELGEAPEPYERLISDALRGGARHFTREERRRGDLAYRAAATRRATTG